MQRWYLEQLSLFSDLPCGRRIRVKRGPCGKKICPPIGEQLSLLLTHNTELVEDDDDPWITAPIVKRTVSARDAAPVTIKAPASVWDMAFAPIAIKPLESGKQKILNVTRVNGVTKCTQVDIQDTEDWKTKEQIRRAKQRPPPPSANFKRISKKFQELVNE